MLWNPLTDAIGLLSDTGWHVVYAAWMIASAVFLLLHKRSPTTTLAWLLVLWSAPILGALGWFLFGPRHLDRMLAMRRRANDDTRVPVSDDGDPLPASFLRDAPLSVLARISRTSGTPGAMPSRATGLTLYPDGTEAYPAILEAIHNASGTIHVEYYIWQPDGIGTRLRDTLAARARDGVTVRVVLDALGSKNCKDTFWQPLLDAGADVRHFNPLKLLLPEPGRLNFRTHRKMVIVDGDTGFLGGINISDDNQPTDDDPVPWRSTHMSMTGAPCTAMQRLFLGDWCYAIPIRGEHEADPAKLTLPDDLDRWFRYDDTGGAGSDNEAGDGPWVQIVDSGPDEPTPDIQELYFAAINEARHRIWLTTPYFVPDAPIEEALRAAAARGVDVQLLLPQKNDSLMVKAAAETFTETMIGAGARVSMYQPRMNHSKTLVIDDGFAIVGTANMDNRSFRLNFELVAAIFDRDVNARLAALFEKDLTQSEPFAPDTADATFGHRLLVNAARLLSPLL